MMQKKDTTSKQVQIKLQTFVRDTGKSCPCEDLGVDLIIAFCPVQTNLAAFVYLPLSPQQWLPHIATSFTIM